MHKEILQMAVIGLVAGFCISAKAAPAHKNQEIAMGCTKCSKNDNNKKCNRNSCSREDAERSEEPEHVTLRNNYSTESSPKAGEFTAKRKSAAQKAMEGY